MTKYSKIPTDDLDIAYDSIYKWQKFELACRKAFIKDGKYMFKFLEKKEKIRCYTLTTLNGTYLKIDLISWKDLANLPPYIIEASLYIGAIPNVLLPSSKAWRNRRSNCNCTYDKPFTCFVHYIHIFCEQLSPKISVHKSSQWHYKCFEDIVLKTESIRQNKKIPLFSYQS